MVYFSDNYMELLKGIDNLPFQAVMQGTFSVDTFFLIGYVFQFCFPFFHYSCYNVVLQNYFLNFHFTIRLCSTLKNLVLRIDSNYSGFLLGYLYLEEADKRNGKINWLGLCLHRFLR